MHYHAIKYINMCIKLKNENDSSNLDDISSYYELKGDILYNMLSFNDALSNNNLVRNLHLNQIESINL